MKNLFIIRTIAPNSITMVVGRRKISRNKIYIKPSYEGPVTIGFACTNEEINKNKIQEINNEFT